MTFQSSVQSIGYATSRTRAIGFLPPIMRAVSHVFYALAFATVPRKFEQEAIRTELLEAQTHIENIALPVDGVLSAHAIVLIDSLKSAIALAVQESIDWDKDTTTQAIVMLINAIGQTFVRLDRELLGMRSDAGSEL